MSETKRATLTTITTQKSEVKKVKERPKTIRFCLSLPESNEKSCPEYNYRDLLNSAEKKNKLKEKDQGQVNGLNHLDPFGDDDDADVKRIAQQFEAKYGLPKTNKKRKGKRDDYADIGAGYDESDSFIDNTDAYDEMVPEDVTTVHGGFYINSGALEFKQVELSGSESSDSETSNVEKPTINRKRIIEDTDESDSEEEKDGSKVEQTEKKQKMDTNGIQIPAKKKIITDEKENIIKENVNKENIMKKKKVEENVIKKMKVEENVVKKIKVEDNILKKKPVTVKELLREKREEFDMTVPPELEASIRETKPSGSSTINDVIESVINAGRVENVDETSKDSTSSSDAAGVGSVASSESESSRDGLHPLTDQPQTEAQKAEAEIPIVKLPDNVPDNIMKIINDIKKAAENSEGKVKFFSGPVNNMLLSLEINSRKLLRSNRVQIYEHLAPFVKCKKDTLMRRAKNLMLDQERAKLKDPLLRLKAYIDNIMPVVKKNYEKECQKVRDEMFLAGATSANSEGDVNSKANKLKIPKKKFPWSEEARKILQEIILIQKKYFALIRTRKETFETNLETFLKATVLPIWPEGFMTISTLKKQSKTILELIEKRKSAPIMKPISLDIHPSTSAPVISTPPLAHSPVKNVSLSPSAVSGITVIPIPPSSQTSPKAASLNGPKVKPSEISVTVNKKVETPVNSTSVINMSAEICAVPVKETKDCNEKVPSSLLVPASKANERATSSLLVPASKSNERATSSLLVPASKSNERATSSLLIPASKSNEKATSSLLVPASKSSERAPSSLLVPASKSNERVPSSLPAPASKSNERAPSSLLVPAGKSNERAPSSLPAPATKSNERASSSLLVPSSKSNVTITSVDLRPTSTSNKKETGKEDEISVSVTENVPQILTPIPSHTVPKPTNLKQRILNDLASNKPRVENDDCQIIDLTDAPVVLRKPGPKSKTRFVEGSIKQKRVKESTESIKPVRTEDLTHKKQEEYTGSHALNQLITGYAKYGSNSTDLSSKPSYKESAASIANEDEMEQVMKDLKELQQLQEHARKNDIDRMAPSSSPVSVIAFNSSYSPSRLQASDLSATKERKFLSEDPGFQDMFQKHLYQESTLLKPNQSSSVYNSNVQPKNSYNSINNFSYTSAGSISSSINNIRYSQSSSKYSSPVNHLPTNPTGATNHTDDFALFQNFLYQYGIHNSSGSKQKSPP